MIESALHGVDRLGVFTRREPGIADLLIDRRIRLDLLLFHSRGQESRRFGKGGRGAGVWVRNGGDFNAAVCAS